MRVKDKVVIVTGAASGIGETTAQVFAEQGGKVVVADIDAKGGEKNVATIKEKGGKAIFVQADIHAKEFRKISYRLRHSESSFLSLHTKKP